MTAIELLSDLRSRGVQIEAKGDRLRIDAPRGVLDRETRKKLAECKSELLTLLNSDDEDIAWRIEAMLPQIPDIGLIPFLVARTGVERGPSQCHSCGEPLSTLDVFICSLCSRAKNLALEKAMRRV